MHLHSGLISKPNKQISNAIIYSLHKTSKPPSKEKLSAAATEHIILWQCFVRIQNSLEFCDEMCEECVNV